MEQISNYAIAVACFINIARITAKNAIKQEKGKISCWEGLYDVVWTVVYATAAYFFIY